MSNPSSTSSSRVPSTGIILYHYPASPYARRIYRYLQHRRLPFASVTLSVTMPRPQLAQLNVQYRRVPLLSIGNDMYCDSRLILRKLETLFPDGALGAALTPDQRGVASLLERWVTDGGLFWKAVGLMPMDSPWTLDSRFEEDRSELMGTKFSMQRLNRGRPEATAGVIDAFEAMERGLLSDGRDWVLGTDAPSLADMQVVWPFHWLIYGMPKALDPRFVSEAKYPKVWAWVRRWHETLAAAEGDPKNKDVAELSGEEALEYVTAAGLAEKSKTVDKNDPTGFKEGDEVEIFPNDYGSFRKDRGKLVALNEMDMAVRSRASNGKELDIHVPRWGFSIQSASSSS